MICFKCKQNIDEDSNYCKYCGAKQAVECGECGAAVPVEARFCPRCDALVQVGVSLDLAGATKEAAQAFGKPLANQFAEGIDMDEPVFADMDFSDFKIGRQHGGIVNRSEEKIMD